MESHDSFWRFFYYPHGTWGDGGGAYQVEWPTHVTAAHLAGLPVMDLSAGAQRREALALMRAYGSHSSMTWGGDNCPAVR